MRVAIDMVKEGRAQACVSAGNTGALMATAKFVLKMLPGIDRPAICTALPSMTGHTWMLDLGANVDVDAEHLLQFAVMGSVMASAVDGNRSPRIGLLNIGEEEIKGNEQVKEAAGLLASSHLNYGGFAEGDDIYKGGYDVVVCDGFVGNVSLKTTEGVAKMIAQFIREEFSRNILTKLAALITMPVLRAFRHRIDPRRYNGASLLGLNGVVQELIKNDVLVVQTGCSQIALTKAGLTTPEAAHLAGPGLKEVCETVGMPPVLGIGSCVDNSRILIACAEMVKTGGLGDSIADLPVAGCAPEYMSEKAISIGHYFVASGVYTVFGVTFPVIKGTKFYDHLFGGLEDLGVGKWGFAVDPHDIAHLMIAHIDKKRKELGIDKARERQLMSMEDRQKLEA